MNIVAKFTKCSLKSYFNNTPLIENNAFNLNATITAGKSINGDLYYAVYSDEKLLKVHKEPISLSADEQKLLNENINTSEYDTTPTKVSVFVWTEGLQPLAYSSTSDIY